MTTGELKKNSIAILGELGDDVVQVLGYESDEMSQKLLHVAVILAIEI